jgi:hypothetical protein
MNQSVVGSAHKENKKKKKKKNWIFTRKAEAYPTPSPSTIIPP